MHDDVLSLERWQAAWLSAGATAADDTTRDELLRRYAEPHRHYHTQQHLAECLQLFDSARRDAVRPGELAIALWFHDGIYDPHREDNEQQSADWAVDAMRRAGLPDDAGRRVHALVMATRHNAAPTEPDAQLLVDIDLAILGAPAERFDEYERQVGEEYAWVPGFIFRRTRKKVLQQFAARPRLYSTERFFASHETMARQNLARSIARL